MFQSAAPGAPPDNPVRGFGTCSCPPRMLQSGASFCRFLSVASDVPVRGPGFPPGRSGPGACAVLHSAPDAPIRGVFLSYSLCCLRRSSPWHRVHPRTIQSGGLGHAPLRRGCSNPGRLFVVFSPMPRTLQSVAPGSPADDPVRGLVLCFIPPRMLQSGASFCRIPSVASDASVRGTWFTLGRSSLGACAVLHSAQDAPIRGVILSYSLRCLRCSGLWHRVLPRTIQSGGLGRAPLRLRCSNPGRLFDLFSPLPWMLQSVAPGSSPDDPVWEARAVLHSGPVAPIRGVMYLTLFAVFSSPTPQRALLRAGFARCGGGTWAPGVGISCLGVGRLGSSALPPPTTRPFGRAAGARFPLGVGAVCGRGGPAVLGTLSRAAVRRVLCALPGFAAPGGRCGLAHVLVPSLQPAACLSGVPPGPVLVRRSSSGPVALGAPVGFPVGVVPSPKPGAVPPGFTGWLRGARGGQPKTGLIVPAAGPSRGKDAGRAPRRTRPGPRDRVVPGGSLRLRSLAACAAVDPVWTRSLTRPVFLYRPFFAGGLGQCSRAVSCGRRHRPLQVGGRHAQVLRVCVCVLFLAGSGEPASRARFGAPHLSFGRSWCALCLFGPLWAGVAPFVVVVGFFFFPFPPSPLLFRPCCVRLCVFSGPGCLWPWRLVAPPSPFFSPPPLSLRPLVSCFSCFPASGSLRLGHLPPPPHPFSLPPPPPVISGNS